ncbi:hypothetical protein EJD97_014069, partial [Solanum chilense]
LIIAPVIHASSSVAPPLPESLAVKSGSRMCKETCASICVLEGPVGNADQIVLTSEISPAMDAVIRIFMCVEGLNNDDPGAVAAFVSSKLLVASAQAIHLIGKNGSTINSIQERSGVVLRVLPTDDRIIEIHGEGTKVLNAFDVVVKLLRKFLVHYIMIGFLRK